jgi:hypothetical protein
VCARDHFTSAFISSLHGKEVGYSNPLTCLRGRVRVVIQTAAASAQSPSYNEGKNAAGALRGQGNVTTRLSLITICTSLVISPLAGPPVREVLSRKCRCGLLDSHTLMAQPMIRVDDHSCILCRGSFPSSLIKGRLS